MTKKEFFQLMAAHKLTVNFDNELTSVDESEPGIRYHQTWRMDLFGGVRAGPDQRTADRLLKYWSHRRAIRAQNLKSDPLYYIKKRDAHSPP